MTLGRFGWMGVSLVAGIVGAAVVPATATASEPGNAQVTSATANEATALDAEEQLSDLEYKRMQDNINKKTPDMVKKFHGYCGYDVSFVIDWGSFGRGKDTLNNLWSNYGIERLADSFESVCKDQAGKDAAKAKIHTIKAINTKDAKAIKITVGGGGMTAVLNWSGSSPGMNESEIGAQVTRQL